MRNIFETPEMVIKTFEAENVVTESAGTVTAESAAKSAMDGVALERGIDLTNKVLTFTFD